MQSQYSQRVARFRVSNPNFLRDHDGRDTMVHRFNDRIAAADVRHKIERARTHITPTGRILTSKVK